MEAIKKEMFELPRPGSVDLLALAMMIQRKPLETYEYIQRVYGDIIFCPWLNHENLFLYHPSDVRYVLKDNHSNYHKSAEYDQLRPLLGNGLLTSEDELWRRQRRLMAREFHAPSIEQYAKSIHARSTAAFEGLPEGRQEVSHFFMRLTFQIAGDIFFGVDLDAFASNAGKALEEEVERINRRMRRPFNFPLSVPTPENIRGRRSLQELDNVVKNIMDTGTEGSNVLGRLMAQEGSMPRKQIRDEVMTLLLAGHETTSNALMWTAFFLGQNPVWQQRLSGELAALGKKASELTKADLPSLPAFKAVLNESMRLMPPIPVISRRTVEDDEIGGHFVPRETNVNIPVWVIHRDARFWESPLSWRPERFVGRTDDPNDCTFLPFAKGPRSCIGADLAMTEATLILAQMIESLSWEAAPGFTPVPTHNITLRSANGMQLMIRKRS